MTYNVFCGTLNPNLLYYQCDLGLSYTFTCLLLPAWVNGVQDLLFLTICCVMNNRRDETICSVILCSQVEHLVVIAIDKSSSSSWSASQHSVTARHEVMTTGE